MPYDLGTFFLDGLCIKGPARYRLLLFRRSSLLKSQHNAFSEDVPHQAGAGQEGQAEQAHPTLDPLQDQQQDPLQR